MHFAKKDIALWQDPQAIDQLASRHYRDLPFHNYPHAQGTARLAVKLACEAKAYGIEIDDSILPAAGRWHDADFYLLPSVDHSFTIKEAASADIAQKEAAHLGMPSDKIALLGDVILSTSSTIACGSLTAVCLRQADLRTGGILGSPLGFLNGTFRLFREAKLLEGKPLISINPATWAKDFVQFGGLSHEVLSSYLQEDLSLGDFQRDKNGRSLINLRAAENVKLLLPKELCKLSASRLLEIVNYRPVGI